MKKKLLIALLAVALLTVVAYAEWHQYLPKGDPNTLMCYEMTGSAGAVHTSTDFPIADILLKGTNADTSVVFDLHGYNEMHSTWRIDEHEADTGRAHCYLQVADSRQAHWTTIDSLGHNTATCRTSDSTWADKDWTFAKGWVYARFIFLGVQGAAETTGVAYVEHCFQQ